MLESLVLKKVQSNSSKCKKSKSVPKAKANSSPKSAIGSYFINISIQEGCPVT